MPLTKEGKKVKKQMRKFYGKEKGDQVFYAKEHSTPSWKKSTLNVEWWAERLENLPDHTRIVVLKSFSIQDQALIKAVWTTKFVNDLPDSAFAYVESGKKDEEGKTVPRSKRHFPIRDKNGKLDPAHVRNAATRAPQSPFGSKAMSKINAAKRELGIGEDKKKK